LFRIIFSGFIAPWGCHSGGGGDITAIAQKSVKKNSLRISAKTFYSTQDIIELPAFGLRENKDVMFIESELLHVNNVNTTDPHFNMPGQRRSEHHKIVILSVLVK
jgi:hypothetical protein